MSFQSPSGNWGAHRTTGTAFCLSHLLASARVPRTCSVQLDSVKRRCNCSSSSWFPLTARIVLSGAMLLSLLQFDGAGAQNIVFEMDMAMHVRYQSPEPDKQRRDPRRAIRNGREVVSQNANLAQRARGLLMFLSHLTRKVGHGTELRHPWRSAVPGRPLKF